MRISGVLFSVVIAAAISGFGSYYVVDRRCNEEITRLTKERELSFVRERELRTQLEEALTARATLAKEAQQLQTDLSERLKRLEEIVMKATPQENITQEREKGDK